ncbi:MAG: hypothetical protein GY929_15760 [Actinomycetia bacterium]|nr:hypothetical protein [Actinomycetes bacterium]
MALDRDAELATLQEKQYGLASFGQLEKVGFDEKAIKRRLDRGIWAMAEIAVIRDATAPATWESRVLAGCLSTGGVASHRTAAVLHQLDGVRRKKPDITVARHDHVLRPKIKLHESTQFDLIARRTIRGIPVTGIERTLLDLAGTEEYETFEIATDSALRLGLTTLPRLADTHRVHRRKGRNGIGPLGHLLESRSDKEAVPDSGGNRKLYNLIVGSGLSKPVLEHPILDGGRHLARADLAYPDLGIAIWLHSIRWHFNHLSFELDPAQQTEVSSLGWATLVFTWKQVQNNPDWVVAQVRRALSMPRAA